MAVRRVQRRRSPSSVVNQASDAMRGITSLRTEYVTSRPEHLDTYQLAPNESSATIIGENATVTITRDPVTGKQNEAFNNDALDISGTVNTPPPEVEAMAPMTESPSEIRPPNISASPVTNVSNIESPTQKAREALADTEIPSPDQSLADIAAEQKKARQQQLGLSGAKFASEIMNANSAYQEVAHATSANMARSRMQVQDALRRGKQRALEARVQGDLEAEDVMIRMAAQGQDVSAYATQSLQQSYEQAAAFNAMQEEIASFREALGYELEQVELQLGLEQAEIQRDLSMISSALNFGAELYGNRDLL